MKEFNKEKAIVFNTLQMYRVDRLEYLKHIHQLSSKENFIYGVKLVRGAYMEKERKRALEMNYPSPIQVNKSATDKDFNDAIHYIVDHPLEFSLCVGSHNEKSNLLLVELMAKNNIDKSSPFQKQLLAPVGTAIFETMWNNAPFAFDFDYGATLMGFLAYKVALLTVVYEEVRKMLITSEDDDNQ